MNKFTEKEIERLFEHLFDDLDANDEQDDVWVDRKFCWGLCSDREPENVFYIFPYDREYDDQKEKVIKNYINWYQGR